MTLDCQGRNEVIYQTILETFNAKESNNLIGREIFGVKAQKPDC